jgi:hypothetical protein
MVPAAWMSFGTQLVLAQMPASAAQPTTEAAAAIHSDFHFPTGQERFHAYLRDTFGPGALLQSAFVAGTNHFDNDPPEWRQGAQGYGRRFASRFGRFTIQKSIEYGLGTVLRQDTSYRRCECSGFLRRMSHALSSNFIARKRDGSRTLTIAKVAGYYGSGMISTAWYPDRYTATGDGVRLGTLSLVSGTGVNVIREFWPEIRRFFRR